MNAEVAAYNESIRMRLAAAVACLDGLTEAQVNWRPSFAEGNSAYALAAHTLGNARAWVLGIACGQKMRRDRPAEFAATGADTERLCDEFASLTTQIADALGEMTQEQLERHFVPPQELWGGGNPAHEITPRYALLHVIEHASLHLGHLELTRDLALQNA
jgi:uncharacterized damage-inducible protein DinB